MAEEEKQTGGIFGLLAMALASVALIGVVLQLTVGPFAPQPTVEEGVAELIVGIKDATLRRIQGEEPPEPQRKPWDVDRIVVAASIGFAGAAMLFAGLGLFRGEPRAPALLGFSVGAGTLLVVWLQWMALIILGCFLIIAVVSALGDILPFDFGG
ncbi:MAG: hypothetical protein AAGA22_04170 [Pseudomonadota bacterium]